MEAIKNIDNGNVGNDSLMEVIHRTDNRDTKNLTAPGREAIKSLPGKERIGLKIIYSHRGKRDTYEYYRRRSPQIALMYLRFVSKYTWAQYITWDMMNKRFTLQKTL